jgi:parallel beta-helix repeat protein
MKRKVVLRIILTLLLTSILVLAFNAKSVAETYYYNFDIAIIPESPTTSDEIEVKISFELAGSYNVTFGPLNQTGNQFSVDIIIYVPEVYLTVIVPVEKTYNLGRLPEGTYVFDATVTITGYGSGYGYHTKSFSVKPDPGIRIVDDDGPADFSSIQEAINAASPGDTIYVKAGTYYEQVVLNKSVSLIGENKETTIIDGNGTEAYEGTVNILADNVTVSGFEIRNNFVRGGINYGIFLNHSSNSTVNGNVVKAQEGRAILVEGGSGNNISDNEVLDHTVTGFRLWNSSNNVVTGNRFYLGCFYALSMYYSNNNYIAYNYIATHFALLKLEESNNNLIVGNHMGWDGWGGIIFFVGSNGNVLYHNIFERYTISIDENSTNNVWDNGYPSGGNYWSGYNVPDYYSGPYQNETGNDCIGDTPYIIDANNMDRFPLLIWGDVNNDGKVSLEDIGKLDIIYSGWISGPPYIDPATGKYLMPDINGDGYVTLADIGELDLIYSGYL